MAHVDYFSINRPLALPAATIVMGRTGVPFASTHATADRWHSTASRIHAAERALARSADLCFSTQAPKGRGAF